MSEPEIIQRQREILRAFRQAAAQRAQIEAEANARRKRELTEITTRYQAATQTAEQDLKQTRARAAEESAAVDKALGQARSALTEARLSHLIPTETGAENRLGLTLAPDAALETSRQTAVAAAEEIQRAAAALAGERAKQAQRRRWALGLSAAALVLLGILAFRFVNYQQAQQAAATATAIAQQAAATATVIAQQAAATATAIAQQAAALRAQFNYQRRGNDKAEMVSVPEGDFTMGSDSGSADEKPVHRVYLDAFWIDVYEVTNTLYKKCVDAGKCQPTSSSSSAKRGSYFGNSQFDDYPVIYVSWNDADAYCKWADKRLPTEAEWEKAARGPSTGSGDARVYPWGNQWDANKANVEQRVGDTTQVGSYPAGVSPYGAMDLVGNVWEWVADWYDSSYYANSLRENPKGPSSGQSRVLRGGAWYDLQYLVRAAARYDGAPDDRGSGVGFRCAQ